MIQILIGDRYFNDCDRKEIIEYLNSNPSIDRRSIALAFNDLEVKYEVANREFYDNESNRSNDIFYVLSMLEKCSRITGCPLNEMIDYFTDESLEDILDSAQVLHCDDSDYVADEIIKEVGIPKGNRKIEGYNVPSHWTQGRQFWRIIKSVVDVDKVSNKELIPEIRNFMKSIVVEYMSDYEAFFYWQPSEYLIECYKANKILE